MSRLHFKIRFLHLVAASASLIGGRHATGQAHAPAGAWVSRAPWSPAPKEVSRDLRAAGAQILYFERDGTFSLWSGTLYSSNHHLPTISAGDSETLYSGRWSPVGHAIAITMRKAYADILRQDETLPGPEEAISARYTGGRLFFKGFWFQRNPSLDEQMSKYAQDAKEAVANPPSIRGVP